MLAYATVELGERLYGCSLGRAAGLQRISTWEAVRLGLGSRDDLNTEIVLL